MAEGRKNINELYSAFRKPVFRGLRFPSVHAQGVPGVMQPNTQGLVTELDVQKFLQNESPNDRLYDLFHRDDHGQFNPSMKFVIDITTQTGVLAFVFGSIVGAREGKILHMKMHKTTRYATKFQAMRAFNDSVMKQSIKQGLLWSLRFAGFTGMLLGTAHCITVYKNKTSFWEYTAAGGLTGSVLRLHLGIKGFIAGGFLGATLGTIAGFFVWGITYAAGERQEDRRAREIREKLMLERQLQLSKTSTPSPKVEAPAGATENAAEETVS